MTRSRSPWYLLSSPVGAVTTLLALALIAPSAAKGGCSHLVTSRYDAGRLASMVEPLMRDLAGQSDPLPTSPAPRPCSGAWCSGQPGVPTVPPGTFEGRLGSWAWCASSPREDATAASFLFAETRVLLPPARGNDVFHPPRLLPPV